MHPRAINYLSNIHLLVFDIKNNFQRVMVLFDKSIFVLVKIQQCKLKKKKLVYRDLTYLTLTIFPDKLGLRKSVALTSILMSRD